MGKKRPTNTTKSGRYMNPTDQARKEARRIELKKNKKQRMLVRQAVLKGKDPMILVQELEQIEKMELETLAEALPTSKALREKKLKMRETIDRVIKCYEKEQNKEMVEQIKRALVEYESKRKKYVTYYQSKREVHLGGNVLENIPLPDNIPLPKELPPTLSLESDYHESIISLLTLPSNVFPPSPPSDTPPKCCVRVSDANEYHIQGILPQKILLTSTGKHFPHNTTLIIMIISDKTSSRQVTFANTDSKIPGPPPG